MHLVLCLGGLPLLPLDLGPARGVGVPLGIRLGRAGSLPPSSPSPSGVGGAGVARSLQTPFSRVSDVVDSPQFSPHVPRRGNSRESSASCSLVLSSRGSRSSDRGSRKDKRARSRESRLWILPSFFSFFFWVGGSLSLILVVLAWLLQLFCFV